LTRASRLVSLLLAVLCAGCGHPQEFGLPKGVPAPQKEGTRTGPSTLKILTWNIWMMPLGLSPSNNRRAPAIAAEVKKLDVDVICFEKAFDGHARDLISEGLNDRFPYHYGPANGGFSLKSNSGVWVVSRFPFAEYHEMRFTSCAGPDCFSRKGAMLLSGAVGGHRFQLVATHLQGEQGTKEDNIRVQDMQEIRDRLLVPYADNRVPLFLAGDFVTSRRAESSVDVDSDAYRFMLRTFQAVNGPEYRITVDENPEHNDLADSDTGYTAELDYVLLRPNGVDLSPVWTRRILRNESWDRWKRHKDLSYRYAVELDVAFPARDAAGAHD
jgi:endonuclease/exonuclease/phosphatase family metal-dependent hydrolase